MKKNIFIKLFLFIAISILLISCNNNSKNLPIVDLDSAISVQDVMFTDLADGIKVVALETGGGFLVTAADNFLVNDKYIVVFSNKAIYQYSSEDGKFIRTLAVKGNGPNEFNFIVSNAIDNTKQILYFAGFSSDKITAIDLNTGNFFPPINTNEEQTTFNNVTSDGKLIISTETSFCSFLDPIDSKIYPLSSEKFNKKENGSKTIYYSNKPQSPVLINKDELFINSDTLYIFKNNNITPYCRLDYNSVENNASPTTHNETDLSLDYVDNNYIITTLTETRMKSDAAMKSVSISKDVKGVQIIDRKTFEPRIVGQFIINPSFILPIDRNISMSYANFSSNGNHISISLDAIKVKNAIKSTFDSNKETLSEEALNQLNHLDSILLDNSNPVYVIGLKR